MKTKRPDPHAGDRRPPAEGPGARGGGAEAPPAKRSKTAKTENKQRFTQEQRNEATNAWVERGVEGDDFSALPPARAFLEEVERRKTNGGKPAFDLATSLRPPRKVGSAIANAKRWANPDSALRKRHAYEQAKKALACWVPATRPPPESVSMGDCYARVQARPIEQAEGKYDHEESASEVRDPGGSASTAHWAHGASIVDYTLYNHRDMADATITLCTDKTKFVKHLHAMSVGGHMDEYAINGKVDPKDLVHVSVPDLLKALDARLSHVEGKRAGTGDSVHVHLNQELSHAIESAYSRGARNLSLSLSEEMPNYTRTYEKAKSPPG